MQTKEKKILATSNHRGETKVFEHHAPEQSLRASCSVHSLRLGPSVRLFGIKGSSRAAKISGCVLLQLGVER